MKRSKFNIVLCGEVVGSKSTWNASIKQVEKLAKQYAIDNNTVLHLVEGESLREVGSYGYTQGFRVWATKSNSLNFKFFIQQV